MEETEEVMSAVDEVLEAYRDMFGTKSDRANETHKAACAEIASLRGFVKELFELADWPDGGDIDGFDFQDTAVKFGVLETEQRTEPCGESCNCAEYYSDDEWQDGITCYRIAAALTKEKIS